MTSANASTATTSTKARVSDRRPPCPGPAIEAGLFLPNRQVRRQVRRCQTELERASGMPEDWQSRAVLDYGSPGSELTSGTKNSQARNGADASKEEPRRSGVRFDC
jgi:hypothetical protein